MRKPLVFPIAAALLAACAQGPATMSDDMRRDLELASGAAPELASAQFAEQQVVSAVELSPSPAPQRSPAPRRDVTAPRRAPVRTPAPVANVQSVGAVAAQPEEVAMTASAPTPEPAPIEAPVADPVISERPTAPPIVTPDGGGMRGGRGGGGGAVVVIRGGRGDPGHCPPPGRRGRGGGVGIVIGGGGRDILINDRVPRTGMPRVSVGVGFP